MQGNEPATPLFHFGHGLSYSTFVVTNVTSSPDAHTRVFSADDTLTIQGRAAVAPGSPAGKLSLLAFYSVAEPTKWARFATKLCGFTKVDVPEVGGVAFAIQVRVADLDAFEPDTGDYEVTSGFYTINLQTDAASKPLASFGITVNGTYSWTWNFNDL